MQKTDPLTLLDILKLSKERHSSRQIAELTGCSKTTACDVLNKAEALGIDFEKAAEMGGNSLFSMIYPPRKAKPIDEAVIKKHEELCRDLRLNRKILWEQYIKENPEGVKYGQFCKIIKQLGGNKQPKLQYLRETQASKLG
ncbi:MAG: hypothetical protein LBT59_02440 [Clostridiales bacterium]|jgi:transposase|nr:hypothetical protein [Clostridiales bacterium]